MNAELNQLEVTSAPARRWKPYPAYRDSGVEWLGEVPGHWFLVPLKRAFSVQLGKMLQSTPASAEDTLEPYLRAANIFWSGVDVNDVNEMWFSSYEKQQYKLKVDDLLVSEGGDVGRTAIWKGEIENCYIQNAVNRVRSKGIHSTHFLFYWMYSLKHCGYIDMLCNKATIAHFTAEKVEQVNIILPPSPEQRAIASFLDRQTAHLDALISRKERLIVLLEEKRAALISSAVTKGLDPNAPMKDSGVEWLGEVPEHWEVRKLKYIANVNLSNVDKKTNEGEDSVKLCNYLDVYYNDYITPDLDFMEATASAHQIDKFALRKGDVIITKDSESWEDIAVSAYVPADIDNVICGYHLAQIRPDFANINGEYLFRSFCAVCLNHQFRIEANGITRFGLGKYAIDNSLFPVPPINEQRAIVSFLNREIARIDALIIKVRDGIEKLNEYRTALISAAVTGKIDVREVV